MSDQEPHNQRRRQGRSRSVSRLAVVQALYQMELSGIDNESATEEFLQHRFDEDMNGQTLAEADHKFFAATLKGVVARQHDIDAALARSMDKAWRYDRIDPTARAVFRSATYELLANDNVPGKVVVHEYLTVAGAFFAEKSDEMQFIAGVLYKLLREIREASATPPSG